MSGPTSETQRVAAALSSRVSKLHEGDELGSVRSLAAEFGVTPDVARRALGHLVRQGQGRAEARRHVVADPAAGIGPSSPAQMTARIAVLEAEVARLSAAQEQSRDLTGRLQAELTDLYARTGHAYPPGTRTAKRSRRTG